MFQKITIREKEKTNKVLVTICNSCGQERFAPFAKILIRKMKGVILFYDITSQTMLNNVEKWIAIIKCTRDIITTFPKILIGNKCDIKERMICKEEGQSLAMKYNEAFECMIKTCYKELMAIQIEEKEKGKIRKIIFS